MRRTLFYAALCLLAASCGGGEKPAPASMAGDQPAAIPAAMERVAEAARVANAIEGLPGSADSILKAAGHTPESFERLMYEIAADSAMSAAYAAARVK